MFFIHGKIFKSVKFFRLGSFVMYRCIPYQIMGHTITSDGIRLVQLCNTNVSEFIYIPFDTKVYDAVLQQESICFTDDDLPF